MAARGSGRVRDLVNESVPKEVAWIGGGWRMKIDIKLTVDKAACRVWPWPRMEGQLGGQESRMDFF